MSPTTVGVLGAILACGGLVVLVVLLRPAPPSLADTMAWLHADTRRISPPGWTRWIRPPQRELRLLSRDMNAYIMGKILWTVAGLAVPVVFTMFASLFGIHLSIIIPTVVALACGVTMFFLYDINLRQHADAARLEVRRVVAVYLSTVALVRLTGAGAVESLERAALIGDGWVFNRIREILADARARNQPPWTALQAMSIDIGVPDLGEIGDIMRLAGDEGAQVAESLQTRSSSMRVQLRTREETESAQRTVLMYVPVTMILLVFIILIGYPAAMRIVG